MRSRSHVSLLRLRRSVSMGMATASGQIVAGVGRQDDTNRLGPIRQIRSPHRHVPVSRPLGPMSVLAEVDGNRTRRTGVSRPNRFEGGGAHQVPGHLRRPP